MKPIPPSGPSPSPEKKLNISTLGQIDLGHQRHASKEDCYYCSSSTGEPTDKRSPLFSFAQAQNVLKQFPENGLDSVDFCGGDPLEHPDILRLLRYAAFDLHLKIRIRTLGHRLCPDGTLSSIRRSLSELCDAGLTELELVLPFCDPRSYQLHTGESFELIEKVLNQLRERKIYFSTSTHVTRHNVTQLANQARFLSKYPVFLHTFRIQTSRISQSLDGEPLGNLPSYSLVNTHLNEAVPILEEVNTAVRVQGLPLCASTGFSKNLVTTIGRFYDPHTPRNEPAASYLFPKLEFPKFPKGWVEPQSNYIPHRTKLGSKFNIIGLRGKRHVFLEPCLPCNAKEACDGLSIDHLASGSTDFLTPLPNFEIAPFHRDRHLYAPGFILKCSPRKSMGSPLEKAFVQYRKGPDNFQRQSSPRVSVIITCYNYGRYLAESLHSVLRQTWGSLEIIIVNDGSTDNSKDVAEEFIRTNPTAPIQLINQENFGQPAQPRNVGIAASRGEYILCLDADDMIAPSMIEECVEELDANPSVGIIYSDRLDFGGSENYIASAEYRLEQLKYFNFLNCCSLFRRKMWEEIGGYRLNIRGCEDWDFWLAGGARGFTGKHIPRPLFRYRNNAEGLYVETVLPELGKKTCQLILNNPELFAPHELDRARHHLSPGTKSPPLVSIILDCDPLDYQPENLILNLLEQSHPSLELIISLVDPELIESLHRRFDSQAKLTLLPCTSEKSTVSRLNDALQRAAGEYVTFIDPRGRFYPTFIEDALARLALFPAATGLFSQVKHTPTIPHDGHSSFEAGHHTLGGLSQADLLVIPESPLMTCLHRTDLIPLIVGFNPDLTPLAHWDYLLRLSYLGLFLPSPTIAGEFRDAPPYPLGHREFTATYQTICHTYRGHATTDLVQLQHRALARFKQGLTILPRPQLPGIS